MFDTQSSLAAAVREVQSPEWAVTRQYLAVHRVSIDAEGEPVVARHHVELRDGRSDVYFKLFDSAAGEDSCYHLVVRVIENDSGMPEIGGVWIEPNNRVYVTVWSEIMSPGELASRIGVAPTRSWTKGDPKVQGRPFPVHARSRWVLEALPGCPGLLDEKFHHLRRELRGKTNIIASLGPGTETTLSIVLDGWAGQFSSVWLERQTARWVAKLGASMDISVYSSGPQLVEEL